MALLPYFVVCLSAFLCVLALRASATAPAGTIQRVTKQQILASIPPNGHEISPVPFLSSPSGTYAAYFVRSPTVPGAGGLGADFCYVEVMYTAGGEEAGGGGRSVWESECRPMSTVNSCTLVFSWYGLEVFDGSESVWHTDANTDDTNFLETLELVDEGDMRIRDKDGELAWRASDEPRAAQHCGAPGSPGIGAALPPFAEPIGQGTNNLPFGKGGGAAAVAQPGTAQAELPQAAAVGGAQGQAEEVGFGAQPLVDNSPYDSGALNPKDGHVAVGVALGLLNLVLVLGLGV